MSIQPAASAVGMMIVFPALTFTGRDFEGLALILQVITDDGVVNSVCECAFLSARLIHINAGRTNKYAAPLGDPGPVSAQLISFASLHVMAPLCLIRYASIQTMQLTTFNARPAINASS